MEDSSSKSYGKLLSAVLNEDDKQLHQLFAEISEGPNKINLAMQLLSHSLGTRHRNILEVLTTNGADINKPMLYAKHGPFQLHNMRPIEFAIVSGNVELVSVLLEMGVDLSLEDQNGQIPLCLACATVNFPTDGVRKILDFGADCNRGYPLNPLQIASACGRFAVVELLLEYGADVHLACPDGNTSLALALTTTFSTYSRQINATATSDQLRKDKLSCARLLLNAGSDVNQCDTKGVSILQSVITNAAVDNNVISLLLCHGANPNVGNRRSGATPLMTVANAPLKTATELMMLLLKNGASINAADKNRNTALHYAAATSNLEKIIFLIKNGAETNALNNKGRRFMDTLSPENYLKFLPHLLGKGVYPCLIAVSKGTNFDSFTSLCGNRLPPTPLTLAIFLCKNELANNLREIGFLTGEDIRWLPGNSTIRDKLPVTALGTYDSVITGPCPLMLMAFVKVSDLVGATPGRQERLKQLGLPVSLQDRLLFKRPSSINVTEY